MKHKVIILALLLILSTLTVGSLYLPKIKARKVSSSDVHTLTVYVMWMNGSYAPNSGVNVIYTSDIWHSGLTNQSGCVSFRLKAENYTLWAFVYEDKPFSNASRLAPVNLNADKIVYLSLNESTTFSIEPRYLDLAVHGVSSEGMPIQGANVTVYTNFSAYDEWGNITESKLTDSEGAAIFHILRDANRYTFITQIEPHTRYDYYTTCILFDENWTTIYFENLYITIPPDAVPPLPEFLSALILPLLMIVTLVAVALRKR